jgi:hypothetical protein
VFAYLCLRGQLWQAGKCFTYTYPFFMIVLAVAPGSLAISPQGALLVKAARLLAAAWLASQAALIVYRPVGILLGLPYPYDSLQGPFNDYPFAARAEGAAADSLRPAYSWDIEPFLARLDGQAPGVLWISTSNGAQDMFWALAMPQHLRVYTVSPHAGHLDTRALTHRQLSLDRPDYLLISRSVWQLNTAPQGAALLYSDDQFSLINLTEWPPSIPLLIGLRGGTLKGTDDALTGVSIRNTGSMEFWSPGTCRVTLPARLVFRAPSGTDLRLHLVTQPAGVAIGTGRVQPGQVFINFPLAPGYNTVTLQPQIDSRKALSFDVLLIPDRLASPACAP